MAAAEETIEGTAEPAEGGLPQMNADTFPSQIFWLVVTFGLLFLVLWRVTLPMIAGTLGQRRNRIEGDLGAAESLRKDAQAALADYESALGGARTRAHLLADENKKRVVKDIEAQRAAADSQAATAMSTAETRIAAEKARAGAGVTAAAAEAASVIVERLIGAAVGLDEAKAVVAAQAKGH
jgi:F-type H+-transporting ATPase subunit b